MTAGGGGTRREIVKRRSPKALAGAIALVVLAAPSAAAQVAIHPATTRPADWERVAVRVINSTDDTIVSVRVEVPDAVTILGVDAAPGWTFRVYEASDTMAQAVEWSGGQVARGEFREFALLSRLKGDAKRGRLVFPVRLTRASGELEDWNGPPGSRRTAPRVTIVGHTVLSSRGAMALAGAAMAVAIVALGLAVTQRPTHTSESR